MCYEFGQQLGKFWNLRDSTAVRDVEQIRWAADIDRKRSLFHAQCRMALPSLSSAALLPLPHLPPYPTPQVFKFVKLLFFATAR